MTTKPKVWKSVLTSVLGLAIYLVVGFLTTAVFMLLVTFLASIPVISDLLGWFFEVRGDSPALLVTILAPFVAYWLSLAAVEQICKPGPTCNLAIRLMGIGLIILQVCFLALNLFADGGGSILSNLANVVAGFLMFSAGNNESY